MKYVFRAVIIALFTFVVFVASSWIWFSTLDLQAQRGRIESMVSQALARDVKIEGPMQLSASMFPRVSIANVRIANPVWASQSEFMVADELEVEISLIELLQGKLHIQYIELNGVSLHLQGDPDHGSNWDFQLARHQGVSSGLEPEINTLQAKNIKVVYYPMDRPPVTININKLKLSMAADEAVVLEFESKVGRLPLNMRMQGGTLEQLFNSQVRWPIKGVLDTDTRDLNVEGYITDLVTLDGTELTFSSKKQPARESIFFGRKMTPIVDRYQAYLSIDRVDNTYQIKLSGEFYGFDISRIYAPGQQSNQHALEFENLKFSANGSGETMSQLLHTAEVDLSGTGIEYQYPAHVSSKQVYQASIDTLNFKAKQDEGFDLLMQGSSNGKPVKIQAVFGEVLTSLWSGSSSPLTLGINSSGVNAQFTGLIKHDFKQLTLDGTTSLQARNVTDIGKLFNQAWPEIAALKAKGKLRFNNRSLFFSDIDGELGSQKVNGEVTLNYDKEFNLSIQGHADSFDIHQVLPDTKIPQQLVMNMQQVNLALQGNSPYIKQCLIDGDWEITATQGQAGWRSGLSAQQASSFTVRDHVFTANKINLKMHDDQLMALTTKLYHNKIPLNISAKLGRFNVLLDETQPYPLNIHIPGVNMSATFQGTLQKPFTKTSLHGQLDVQGQLSKLAQLIDIPLDTKQTTEISADLLLSKKGLSLTNTNVKTEGVELNGKLNYQTSQSPNLTINTSGHINLLSYMENKKSVASKKEKATKTSRIIPDLTLDFSRLSSFDTSINLKELELKYKQSSIINLNGQFTAAKGVFTLDPLKTRSPANDSTSLSRVKLDSLQQPPQLEYEFHAKNINYGDILRKLEISTETSGSLDLDVKVTAQGNNVREMAASTNGELQLVVDKGLVPRRLLEVWGAGLLTALSPTNWMESSVTDLNCAVGKFNFENGVMISETLLADTRRVTVAGEVLLNWQTEKIDGLIKPQPKDATLIHVGTPLRLSGTLTDPRFSSAESGFLTLGKWVVGLSNPAYMIVLFGDTGARNKNPCETLLGKKIHK